MRRAWRYSQVSSGLFVDALAGSSRLTAARTPCDVVLPRYAHPYIYHATHQSKFYIWVCIAAQDALGVSILLRMELTRVRPQSISSQLPSA